MVERVGGGGGRGEAEERGEGEAGDGVRDALEERRELMLVVGLARVCVVIAFDWRRRYGRCTVCLCWAGFTCCRQDVQGTRVPACRNRRTVSKPRETVPTNLRRGMALNAMVYSLSECANATGDSGARWRRCEEAKCRVVVGRRAGPVAVDGYAMTGVTFGGGEGCLGRDKL